MIFRGDYGNFSTTYVEAGLGETRTDKAHALWISKMAQGPKIDLNFPFFPFLDSARFVVPYAALLHLDLTLDWLVFVECNLPSLETRKKTVR